MMQDSDSRSQKTSLKATLPLKFCQTIVAPCRPLLMGLIIICLSHTLFGRNIIIPDANFKAFLLSNYDTNLDSEISNTEAEAVVGLLNCSFQNIRVLAGIEAFINIEQLYCYSNQLDALPDLSTLTKLKILDCSINHIEVMPHLCEMIALEHVICNGNELDSLPIVDNLPNLIELTCNGNNFTLCNFPAIYTIDLKGLTTFVFNPQKDGTVLNCPVFPAPAPNLCFPDTAFKLKLLSIPGIDTNLDLQISVDEAQAYNGTISISNQPFQDIAGIDFFSNTTELWANNCTLTHIPPLCRLQSLTRLGVYKNALVDVLPLSCLSNLEHLWLNQNQISTLPKISTLANLSYLDFSENQVATFPELPPPGNMIYLSCYRNQLTQIPSLSNQTQLTDLNFTENQLCSSPDLPSPSVLQHLNGVANLIETLPDLSGQSELITIGFAYNRLTQIPEISDKPFLSVLDFSYNHISSPPVLRNLPLLANLFLNNNNLSTINPLTEIPSLQVLDLSSNRLTTLPEDWGNLPLLHSLTLYQNRLQQLPDLSQLPSLTRLYCSKNRLTQAPVISMPMLFVFLENNYLNESQCPVLLQNATNVQSFFSYSPQGDFFLLNLDLSLWPVTPSPLFDWVQAVSSSSYEYELICE